MKRSGRYGHRSRYSGVTANLYHSTCIQYALISSVSGGYGAQPLSRSRGWLERSAAAALLSHGCLRARLSKRRADQTDPVWRVLSASAGCKTCTEQLQPAEIWRRPCLDKASCGPSCVPPTWSWTTRPRSRTAPGPRRADGSTTLPGHPRVDLEIDGLER